MEVVVLGWDDLATQEMARAMAELEDIEIKTELGEDHMLPTSLAAVMANLFGQDTLGRSGGYSYPLREGRKGSGAASLKRAASKRRNIRARSKK